MRWAGLSSSSSSRSSETREVGAALGAGDGVHLVDDDRLDAAQRLAGLGGEHQEQRLGGGDQDVGRRRLDPATVLRRGVTRAHADPDLGHLDPEPLGGLPDADQRSAQVALDVDGERLQRRDVEDPAAASSSPAPARWPAGRSTRGTPTASCPSRSARPPGRAGPPRSRPTPRSAQGSARAKAAANHSCVAALNWCTQPSCPTAPTGLTRPLGVQNWRDVRKAFVRRASFTRSSETDSSSHRESAIRSSPPSVPTYAVPSGPRLTGA